MNSVFVKHVPNQSGRSESSLKWVENHPLARNFDTNIRASLLPARANCGAFLQTFVQSFVVEKNSSFS
jgi:hypothetical protein